MYVLIVIFLAGYGPRPDIHTQEYSSAKTCQLAQKVVLEGWSVNNDQRILLKAVCVPK